MADRQGVIRVVEMGAMQSTRVQAAFRLEHAAEGPEASPVTRLGCLGQARLGSASR